MNLIMENAVAKLAQVSENRNDLWQWSAKADGTIFPDIATHNDFTVLVGLAADRADMMFYVVPTRVLDKWLKDEFANWLATPGKKGQQRSAANKKRHLLLKQFGAKLEPYREGWETLWSE